tara:strand:+ start:10 stop:783 length:774 start_codon:yes stop_codon:yes gene_type:complete
MTKLYSNILGEGDNHLIILHGFLGMSDNWKSLGINFSKLGFKVHLIDQRNHGRSFWEKDFSYEILVEDLLFYMNQEKITKSIIIGHSMGGKTAMKFCSGYPERISKLIIIDISPKKYNSSHDKILKGLTLLNFEIIKTRKDADLHLSKYILESEIRQFLLKNLYWIVPGKLALRLNISVLKNSSQIISKEVIIKNIFNKPVLFLKGQNSDYISNNDTQLLEKYFSNFQIKTIKNSGHWLHAENPIDFMKTVNNFLNV